MRSWCVLGSMKQGNPRSLEAAGGSLGWLGEETETVPQLTVGSQWNLWASSPKGSVSISALTGGVSLLSNLTVFSGQKQGIFRL